MGGWVSEFPNDNPDLFSQHPGPPDDAATEASQATLAPPEADAPLDVVADEPIEVVDRFDDADFAHATLESVAPPPPEAEPSPDAEPPPAPALEAPDDAVDYYRLYVDALREVAVAFGAPAAVAQGLALTLEADPVARMWRVAIGGGEPDFSTCAQTLDEWSAHVVARLAGAADAMVEPIRRALRARGVCAFGLVVEAA